MAAQEPVTHATLYAQAVEKTLSIVNPALTEEQKSLAQMIAQTTPMAHMLTQLHTLARPHAHLIEDLEVEVLGDIIKESVGNANEVHRVLNALGSEQCMRLAKMLRFFFHMANKLQD